VLRQVADPIDEVRIIFQWKIQRIFEMRRRSGAVGEANMDSPVIYWVHAKSHRNSNLSNGIVYINVYECMRYKYVLRLPAQARSRRPAAQVHNHSNRAVHHPAM
jgi:hypothetical protein